MSRPMRVAVVNLTSGGLSGGYRTYLRELVPRLARHHDIGALSVALPPGSGFDADSLGAPCAEWSPGTRPAPWVRAFVRDHDVDVVFIPTARWCDTGRPVVVMVRNMEPLVRPWTGNSLRDGLRNVLRRVAAREACRRADRVIAVSDFVSSVLSSRWSIPAGRIGVVRHGVAPALRPEELERPPGVGADGAPFIFTAGSIRPARGLEDLIGALPQMTYAPSLQLVIAGHVDSGAERYARRLRMMAESLGVADRVTWTGNLSTSAMRWCFTNAACFVTTSRVEACPNTALEAMAQQALSVATNVAPMPEFFADCARYYTAGDARSLADAVRATLALSPSEAQHLRGRAGQRAGHFTWDGTADRTVDELRRALLRPTQQSGAAHFADSGTAEPRASLNR